MLAMIMCNCVCISSVKKNSYLQHSGTLHHALHIPHHRQYVSKQSTAAALPQYNEASAELITANGGMLLRAQVDSVANQVTDRSTSDRCALT